MFQMALLHLKDNNCAILFWNPCLNVQVMAQTSSIYDHSSFDFQEWPRPSNYLNNCFRWNCYSSRITTVPNYFEIHALIYNLWPRLAQFMTIFWPSSVTFTFNLPEQMFQIALLPIKENNRAKWFWIPCIKVDVMARTNLDGWTHACTMHAHTLNWNCNNYVSMTLQAGSTINTIVKILEK